MKPQRPPAVAPRNLVAKHAAKFCKPATHRDKKKDYQRTPKHRHRDFGVFCGPLKRFGDYRRTPRLGLNCG